MTVGTKNECVTVLCDDAFNHIVNSQRTTYTNSSERLPNTQCLGAGTFAPAFSRADCRDDTRQRRYRQRENGSGRTLMFTASQAAGVRG